MDTQAGEQAVMAWLKQNAIPLQHIEAGNGFADLQPLKQLLKDVKVVGLGETTHGTREIFQLKHRLVEFLVTEMGFDTFAIEASYAACQPINDYILYGKGDRAAVLTGQWYVVWDTEEIADMLDWMRMYNQNAPSDKKLTFYGLDITRNEIGRQAVLDYLHKVAPDQVAAAETVFAALAREETKWPLQIDEATEAALKHLLPQLQALMDYLIANKERLVRSASLSAFEQALQYMRVMKQFIMVSVTELLPPSQDKGTVRSISMAENLLWLAGRAKPDAKLIVWEHNGHVRVADTATEAPNLGACLRAQYGDAYSAIGFEFNEGTVLTRPAQPDKLPGDLKEVTLAPASAGTFPWYLARTGLDVFALDLRAPAGDPVVEQWLEAPQLAHHVNWRYQDGDQAYLQLRRIRQYDAIIFINKTTASRPTANALDTVSRHDGL